MHRIAKFEKVSFGIFESAFKGASDLYTKDIYDNIIMPERATSGSAGYDFKSPYDFVLPAGDTVTIPTGVRVKIDEGWFLALFPRSGHGFKYRIQLDNTVGIIDSDFYHSPGEGHIMVKITNDGRQNKTLEVSQGTGFVQGIFIPYGITYSDEVLSKRTGGFGSTDN